MVTELMQRLAELFRGTDIQVIISLTNHQSVVLFNQKTKEFLAIDTANDRLFVRE